MREGRGEEGRGGRRGIITEHCPTEQLPMEGKGIVSMCMHMYAGE